MPSVKYTEEFKDQVIGEVLGGKRTITDAANLHKVSRQSVLSWVGRAKARAKRAAVRRIFNFQQYDTSTSYADLFPIVYNGGCVVAFFDRSFPGPNSDLVELDVLFVKAVKTLDLNHTAAILFQSNGYIIGHVSVHGDDMEKYKELFIKECKRLKLQWIV